MRSSIRIFFLALFTLLLVPAPLQAQKSETATTAQPYEVCRAGNFLHIKSDDNLLVLVFFGDTEAGGVDLVLGHQRGRSMRNADGCLFYEFVPITHSEWLDIAEKIDNAFGCPEYNDSCQRIAF
jgi:hypothetical protein